MHRKARIICLSLFLMFFQVIFAQVQALELSAESAVVICAESGQIIYAKNEIAKKSMASTTKIMTALLALEKVASQDVEVAINERMLAVEGSSMGLQLGNILPLSSLVKGMLSVSGNDAATSAAIAIGGTIEKFADMMNEKAKQIGMQNTHFVTPSGLDHPEHYSTAYDMALLGAYALENRSFYDICSQQKIRVPFISPEETRMLRNSNRMLRRYEGCIGVKTGFTKKSGRCLVTAAERNGTRLVAATLNAGDDWNDHEKLLDFGFSQLVTKEFKDDDIFEVPLVGANNQTIKVAAKASALVTVNKGAEDKIERIVNLPHFIYAPTKKEKMVGKIEYFLDGKLLATNDLYSKSDEVPLRVKQNIFQSAWALIERLFGA